MAQLQSMPSILVSKSDLKRFGDRWISNGENLSRTPPESSLQLGNTFDIAVGKSLSKMLGDIPIETPSSTTLLPVSADCVEVGPVRIVGGVRPQNFDAGYRPDGPRFVFDSKTLNDTASLGKNLLNMINDIATEATTVHTRFPHALVTFMLIVPKPCMEARPRHAAAAIQTLDRLAMRRDINDPDHLAEAIAVVVWDPTTGEIDQEIPAQSTNLRIEDFSKRVEEIYITRYKGLPPHANVTSGT